MNTPQNRYKIYNFTLSVSSFAALVATVRDYRCRPLPVVRLMELVVRNVAESYPMFAFSINILLWYSLMSLWAENL